MVLIIDGDDDMVLVVVFTLIVPWYGMAYMDYADYSYGVFPYGYSGIGCCVYTDYVVFYGDYGCFVGLCALSF